MRRDFSLYDDQPERCDEAVSVRTYIHDTGKAHEYHDKGIKLLQHFLSRLNKPAQELLGFFDEYKKAMSEPQHLGQQKTTKTDVTSTLRNILREIYGTRRFDSIDTKVSEVESHLKALEVLLNGIVGEDVSQSISDLSKTKRQLDRENPQATIKPRPARKKPAVAPAPLGPDEEHAEWEKNLPREGTPDWDKWVAMRAHHIQQQKEKAFHRGDQSKDDHINGQDWWDHKAHWKKASDEINKYVNSGRDNKKFAWSKHYNDWRGYIGFAINEYYDLKEQQELDFIKSIMPPRPKTGYM